MFVTMVTVWRAPAILVNREVQTPPVSIPMPILKEMVATLPVMPATVLVLAKKLMVKPVQLLATV